MNLAVTQDPRDHDPGYPGYETNNCSVFKSIKSNGSIIQKFKQIGF